MNRPATRSARPPRTLAVLAVVLWIAMQAAVATAEPLLPPLSAQMAMRAERAAAYRDHPLDFQVSTPPTPVVTDTTTSTVATATSSASSVSSSSTSVAAVTSVTTPASSSSSTTTDTASSTVSTSAAPAPSSVAPVSSSTVAPVVSTSTATTASTTSSVATVSSTTDTTTTTTTTSSAAASTTTTSTSVAPVQSTPTPVPAPAPISPAAPAPAAPAAPAPATPPPPPPAPVIPETDPDLMASDGGLLGTPPATTGAQEPLFGPDGLTPVTRDRPVERPRAIENHDARERRYDEEGEELTMKEIEAMDRRHAVESMRHRANRDLQALREEVTKLRHDHRVLQAKLKNKRSKLERQRVQMANAERKAREDAKARRGQQGREDGRGRGRSRERDRVNHQQQQPQRGDGQGGNGGHSGRGGHHNVNVQVELSPAFAELDRMDERLQDAFMSRMRAIDEAIAAELNRKEPEEAPKPAPTAPAAPAAAAPKPAAQQVKPEASKQAKKQKRSVNGDDDDEIEEITTKIQKQQVQMQMQRRGSSGLPVGLPQFIDNNDANQAGMFQPGMGKLQFRDNNYDRVMREIRHRASIEVTEVRSTIDQHDQKLGKLVNRLLQGRQERLDQVSISVNSLSESLRDVARQIGVAESKFQSTQRDIHAKLARLVEQRRAMEEDGRTDPMRSAELARLEVHLQSLHARQAAAQARQVERRAHARHLQLWLQGLIQQLRSSRAPGDREVRGAEYEHLMNRVVLASSRIRDLERQLYGRRGHAVPLPLLTEDQLKAHIRALYAEVSKIASLPALPSYLTGSGDVSAANAKKKDDGKGKGKGDDKNNPKKKDAAAPAPSSTADPNILRHLDARIRHAQALVQHNHNHALRQLRDELGRATSDKDKKAVQDKIMKLEIKQKIMASVLGKFQATVAKLLDPSAASSSDKGKDAGKGKNGDKGKEASKRDGGRKRR
ncbi:hypothetical protein H9P43_004289 [Blastocladiella emersonii ATCC 22665]|nr:hypothetical protein H9P43_004289 [Blastocladiella emersonii ATCC 22665]